MSQGNLAKAVGVTVGTIQNYEHDRTPITTDRLAQLAQALKCEPADLLRPPGSPPPRYRHGYRTFQQQTALRLADRDPESTD